jgi:hypothetical protein
MKKLWRKSTKEKISKMASKTDKKDEAVDALSEKVENIKLDV